MSVYNIYFSPTGGTKRVGDAISCTLADNLSVMSNDINLLMKEQSAKAFSKDDICIISAPAYGGRMPKLCSDKIKLFNGNGACAVVVAVFGNRAIDDTLAELYDIAVASGFKVVAGIEAVAEHSLARIYGSGRPDNKDIEELHSFVKKISDKLNSADASFVGVPGNRPYKEAKASPMSPVIDDNCISCKKCAVECPVDAISMDDVKMINPQKCFSCMHCVSVCPVGARHNSPELTKAVEERLKVRCADAKPNKLYIGEN